MKEFFVKVIYKIIDLQKKFLNWYYGQRYEKSIGKSFSSKTYITAGEMMHLDAQEKLDAKKVVDDAKSVFKENFGDPQKVFDYIKNSGTPVFFLKKAKTALWFLGEEEGFIPPKNGILALGLSLLINIFGKGTLPIGFGTPGLFVLYSEKPNPYFLAYQLYHWMAFSKNLSGYDPKTVKNFKNIFNLEKDIVAMKNLSIEEILSLREAIARDVEAIDMVVALAKEISGQKKASDKLKKDGNISI